MKFTKQEINSKDFITTKLKDLLQFCKTNSYNARIEFEKLVKTLKDSEAINTAEGHEELMQLITNWISETEDEIASCDSYDEYSSSKLSSISSESPDKDMIIQDLKEENDHLKQRSEEKNLIIQGLQEKNERMQEKKERFDMYQEEKDIRTKRMIDDIILQFQQEKIKMQRTQFEQHGNIEGVFNSENSNHTNQKILTRQL